MANNNLIPYENIYSEIKETLLLSRNQAYSAVNFAMVQAYWQIGRIIVEHEQDGNARAGYGKSVLQELSCRLTKDFGKGFSVRTLQQMKKFYVMFPNTNALRSQLTWTHYRLLLSVENEQAIVKYSVLNDAQQVFASRYRLALPTAEELQHEIEAERRRIEEQEG